MNISLEANLLFEDRWSGVQTYSYHMIDEMASTAPDLMFHLHCDRTSTNARFDHLLEKPNIVRHDRPKRHNVLLPFDLLRLRSRAFLSLQGVLKTPMPCAAALTVYDCGWFRHPEFYEPSEIAWHVPRLRRSIPRASLILTISESVKADVADIFSFDPARIVVAPPGAARPLPGAPARKPDALPANTPFFLLVNPGRAYKNWEDALAAFAVFLDMDTKQDEMHLVLAGDLRDQAEPIAKTVAGHPRLRERVLCLGYVEAAELTYLYRQARGIVIPSLFEGFGIPALEAMAHDCPVILSDIPVFREVAQDASLFFPVGQTEALADAMRRLDTDSGLRQDLIAKGAGRVDSYTWQDSARIAVKALLVARK